MDGPHDYFLKVDITQQCRFKIIGITFRNKNKSWLEPKVFTHTCSSKASSITAFTASFKNVGHKPMTDDGLLKCYVPIIMCADDKKSVDIFQKSQTEGIHV